MTDQPAAFGRLQEVPLRAAWAHEAHKFTPWLAQNLEQLAEAVGMQLELEATEVPVTSFSADILARNPQDDSLVLIENQLEGSDHIHLGQILTYMSGLNVKTVIWVAREFREAHLSALKWLNDHTIEPFAFFAVRLKVVRIADSPFAPIFEVLCRPNHWERQLQAAASTSEQLSALGQARLDFWTHYLAAFPDEAHHGHATATSSRWHMYDGIEPVIVLYVGRTQAGLFIRGPRGSHSSDIFTLLQPHAPRLDSTLGAKIGNDDTGQYFIQSLKGDTANPADRQRLFAWLHATANRYEAALKETLASQPSL